MTSVAGGSVSAAIVAFSAGAWAFRAPERAAGRGIVDDALAAAIAGARTERVEDALPAFPAPVRLHASLFGRPEAATPIAAAFLNALAVGSDATIATPAVFAAFAAGEGTDAAGAVVLDAIVAGCEIAVRLARALGEPHAARGWDVRGTAGRVGAAVAAGRVLGLQREPMRDAIGIAATAAGGLANARETMVAAFVPAAAAADGVEAALLARAGFTGAPAALEGRRGLAALMSPAFDEHALLDGLGEAFVFTAALVIAPRATAGAAAIRDAVARIDRLPSIRDLTAVVRAATSA